jgi:hypothetical protein
MSEYRRFHCKGCNLIFSADLLPDEVRVCPLCAGVGCIERASEVLRLCSRCGAAVVQHELSGCTKCFLPTCSDCLGESGLCSSCRQHEAWMDQPTSTIQ